MDLYALEHPVVILVGETGCGKTTGAAVFGRGGLDTESAMAVTQPRLLAAIRWLARAAEMGTALGAGPLVTRCASTRGATDGHPHQAADGRYAAPRDLSTLLRAPRSWSWTRRERSLGTDRLLGLCKDPQAPRNTPHRILRRLDELFRDFFAEAAGDAIVGVPGQYTLSDLLPTATVR